MFAFTAFGVVASVSDVLLVALRELNKAFSRGGGVLCGIFPVSRSYAALTAFGVAASVSDVLLVALLN